ncbi:TolB family protein [Plantactinospora siamensis]|uniref:TolB family protein n=1 Tax=Plantactinospora siamensis TaxID=555372 RepID=A0ABV6NSK8_9ACTN
MSHDADQLLRTTLREPDPAVTLPPGLAAAAVRRGRRLRRRRRAAMVLGAVVAGATLVTPFLVLRPGPGHPVRPAGPDPAASAVPTATDSTAPKSRPAPAQWRSGPLTLPGGWTIVGATGTGEPVEPAIVLDRSRGRYVTVNGYDEVWAAPRGSFAAVFRYQRRAETGILDIGTGRVRWFRTGAHIMTPQWSPDGTRLLLTLDDKDNGTTAIGVLTAASGAVRRWPVDTQKYFCTDQCFFTWSRDGQQVVFQQTDPGGPLSESVRPRRRGLQLFSSGTGLPTRLVPVHGDAAGPYAWSPDGSLVVVQGQQQPELAETGTGRVRHQLPGADVYWGPDGRLLVLSREAGACSVGLMEPDGRLIESQDLPAELCAGRTPLFAPR